MSISNTFNWNRFLRVYKQNMIHNNKLMLYASVGYCGVVFIVLTIGQLGNSLEPFTINVFLQFMVAFLAIFGVLYIGYSFPAFRNKENSISYLTLPASTFEKVLFEFINRIVLSLIALPLLFWLTFNLHGSVFELFSGIRFDAIGIRDILEIDISPVDEMFWAKALILSCTILIGVLPFTGAAMFSKQPLIKTLFSISIILMSYFGMIYIIVEPLGLNNYSSNEELFLVPTENDSALRFFATFASASALVMLSVAYLKVKEKEV